MRDYPVRVNEKVGKLNKKAGALIDELVCFMDAYMDVYVDLRPDNIMPAYKQNLLAGINDLQDELDQVKQELDHMKEDLRLE